MAQQESNNSTNHTSEHQQAHEAAFEAAQEAHEQAHNAANEAAAAAAAAQEAHNAAFQEFSTMTGNADYLKNVGSFVAAALDPLGIDVQVDIETPEGVRDTVKSSTRTASSSSSSSSSSTTRTVVEDKKDDQNTVEIPIKIIQKEKKEQIYPSLPEEATATPTTSSHPDPKIQVALQAMMNM